MNNNFTRLACGSIASLFLIVASCGSDMHEQPLPALADLTGKWVCENNAAVYFVFTGNSGYLHIENLSENLSSKFKEVDFSCTYSLSIGDAESSMFYLTWTESPYSGYTPRRELLFTSDYYDYENPCLTWYSDLGDFYKRKFLH
ncbi:MAG: hypothetical protein LBG05_06650 [Treponema sp.]|jgi:hypothetical protein|nr:hypothetical protein [Treponema sp.]